MCQICMCACRFKMSQKLTAGEMFWYKKRLLKWGPFLDGENLHRIMILYCNSW